MSYVLWFFGIVIFLLIYSNIALAVNADHVWSKMEIGDKFAPLNIKDPFKLKGSDIAIIRDKDKTVDGRYVSYLINGKEKSMKFSTFNNLYYKLNKDSRFNTGRANLN